MRGLFTYKKVLSPAKLNLWLKIGGPRPDGYHPIESLMLPVNWGDLLEYRLKAAPERSIDLQMTGLKGLKPAQNLAYRAAEAFGREFSKNFHLELKLLKRIPAGAGLGGGSSNAASVLKILAGHFGVSLENIRLKKVAAKLGADVAVFLRAKPSWCEGIGEKIRVLQLPILHFVIVLSRKNPVATPWAYRMLDQSRAKSPRLPGIPSWIENEFEIPSLENDFESLVLEQHPRFVELRRAVARSGAMSVCMSGSGSAFFGVYKSQALALRGAQKLSKEGYEAVSCRSLSL